MATTFTNQAALSYNGSQILSNVAVGILESTIAVSKYAVQESYRAGDTLTYVISMVNSGGSALEGLTVSDDLGAYAFGTGTVQPLDYVAGSVQYYQNGVLQPDPTVTTTDGLSISGISIPVNGNVTIVYSATLNDYAPLAIGSTVDNTVTVSGGGIGEATASESVPVLSEARLELVKSVSPIPVSENGRVTYTFQLINSGNTAVLETDGATVSDVFSPTLSDITVTLDGVELTAVTDYVYTEATGAFNTVDGVLAIPAASFTQDPTTGEWSSTPGSTTLTVTGNISTVSP